MKVNEVERDKRLIEEFVVQLNNVYGSSYRVTSWPDKVDRSAKAIDAIAQDSLQGRVLAIEHTLLQAFPGECADSVRFREAAGQLDRRPELTEPGWHIELSFAVGAIPTGVPWGQVGDWLVRWFSEVSPTLSEGLSTRSIQGPGFSFTVDVEKQRYRGPGMVMVLRVLPLLTPEPLREALAAKLPKLSSVPANDRILLLELASPARSAWAVGDMIEALGPEFPLLSQVHAVWAARTTAWESEDYVTWSLVWPLPQAHAYRFGADG